MIDRIGLQIFYDDNVGHNVEHVLPTTCAQGSQRTTFDKTGRLKSSHFLRVQKTGQFTAEPADSVSSAIEPPLSQPTVDQIKPALLHRIDCMHW